MTAAKVVGKLDSWSDADVGSSMFMKLEEGDNVVRCVSSPNQFYSHWAFDASGQKRKVRCALKDCPACALKDPEQATAKASWFVAVLNRKTNKPAVLEIGQQVCKAIASLSKNKKWGDPRQYDINIQRGPKGTNPLYSVVPEPKEPLNDTEKSEIREWMSGINLEEMSKPSTPEEVAEKLGISLKKEEVEVDTDTSNSDDVDFDFDK